MAVRLRTARRIGHAYLIAVPLPLHQDKSTAGKLRAQEKENCWKALGPVKLIRIERDRR
jgi:hypothetical protein